MLPLHCLILVVTACGHSDRRELTRADFAQSVVHTSAEYASAPHLVLDEWRPACREPAHCTLGTIAAGDVGPAGNAVLAPTGDVLQEFDSSGDYVRSIGHTGIAADAYRTVTDLAVDENGAITVFDMGNLRLLTYDSLGTLTRMVQLRPVELFTRAAVWRNRLLLFTIPVGDSIGQPVRATFDAVDPSGRSVHPVAVVRAPATAEHTKSDLRPLPPFFMPQASWAAGPRGTITYTSGASAIVQRYDSAGHGQLFLDTGVPPRRVTAREVESERKRTLASFPSGVWQARVTPDVNRRATHAAKVHAVFTRVRVLGDGTTWLREGTSSSGDSVRWDAFRSSGAWLGWIELPTSARVLGGVGDRLLVVTTDQSHQQEARWVHLAAPHIARR